MLPRNHLEVLLASGAAPFKARRVCERVCGGCQETLAECCWHRVLPTSLTPTPMSPLSLRATGVAVKRCLHIYDSQDQNLVLVFR